MPDRFSPQGATEAASPAGVPLIVDLDGTLIASDMLHESLWALASRDVTALPGLVAALGQGRAGLKAHLADRVAVDPAGLPYRAEVLALIAARRAAGDPVFLVTASDQRVAEAIAAHLGIFDGVQGSDGSRNLKGPEKAAFLVARHGAGGFDYAGDSRADLAVWAQARAVITVAAAPGLRAAAAALGKPVTHLGSPPGGRGYLRALRPHQWLKNILVFLPAVAAHSTDAGVWTAAALAFAAFSLVASGVYVLNDLLDLAADRAHPRKRNRPFASGAVPLLHGSLMAPGLLVAGLSVGALTGEGRFLLVLLVYFALTTAYSWGLKRRLIIDIFTLSGLYTLRVIAGGVAAGLVLSPWLAAFSIFIFLALAAVKRQAELVDGIARGQGRASGRAYEGTDLPIVATMALAAGYVAVLVLALYIDATGATGLYADPRMLWAVCPVLLYWISRMVMIAHRGQMDDDPIVFAARDRTSQACGVLIALIATLATTGLITG